jgi:hypothetical protein
VFKIPGIESGRRGVVFHDPAYRVRRQRLSCDPIALADRDEDGPVDDLGGGQPGVERVDRLERTTARDWDLRSGAFLVGLRPADVQQDPFGMPLKVGDFERRELGPAKRGHEADQQDRAVTPTDQGVLASRKH